MPHSDLWTFPWLSFTQRGRLSQAELGWRSNRALGFQTTPVCNDKPLAFQIPWVSENGCLTTPIPVASMPLPLVLAKEFLLKFHLKRSIFPVRKAILYPLTKHLVQQNILLLLLTYTHLSADRPACFLFSVPSLLPCVLLLSLSSICKDKIQHYEATPSTTEQANIMIAQEPVALLDSCQHKTKTATAQYLVSADSSCLVNKTSSLLCRQPPLLSCLVARTNLYNLSVENTAPLLRSGNTSE